jgi:hypothetical protein
LIEIARLEAAYSLASLDETLPPLIKYLLLNTDKITRFWKMYCLLKKINHQKAEEYLLYLKEHIDQIKDPSLLLELAFQGAPFSSKIASFIEARLTDDASIDRLIRKLLAQLKI